MIFAVLDVSLIMGLNIGETDSFFYINICCFCRKILCFLDRRRYDQKPKSNMSAAITLNLFPVYFLARFLY